MQAGVVSMAAVRAASSEAARTRLQAMRLAANQVRPLDGGSRITMAASSRQSLPALRDVGNAVIDKVGAQNPLLAESKIVPVESERDALLPPPTEMAQSFDSVPSVRNVTTKKKVRQSKNVSLQEETMEAVNFLNLINLRLLP